MESFESLDLDSMMETYRYLSYEDLTNVLSLNRQFYSQRQNEYIQRLIFMRKNEKILKSYIPEMARSVNVSWDDGKSGIYNITEPYRGMDSHIQIIINGQLVNISASMEDVTTLLDRLIDDRTYLFIQGYNNYQPSRFLNQFNEMYTIMLDTNYYIDHGRPR